MSSRVALSNPPQFPRMPWYPRDFASATRGWPLAARAVYRELLDAQWDAGGLEPGLLPDDESVLRGIAGATPAEWRIAWRLVKPKFPRVDGGRRNERLEHHRQEAVREYLNRRKGAASTNAKRWGEGSADSEPVAQRVGERVAQRPLSVSLLSDSLLSDSPPPPPPPPPARSKRLANGGTELIRSKAVGNTAGRVKP